MFLEEAILIYFGLTPYSIGIKIQILFLLIILMERTCMNS